MNNQYSRTDIIFNNEHPEIFFDEVENSQIETLRVKFDQSYGFINLGAFALSPAIIAGKLTVDPHRSTALKNWAINAGTATSLGMQGVTVHAKFERLKQMLSWCDKANFHSALHNMHQYNLAVEGYTEYLQECFLDKNISASRASEIQREVLLSGNWFFENYVESYVLKRLKPGVKLPKPLPSGTGYSASYKFCYNVFNQLTDHLITFTKLPFFLGLSGVPHWIIPSKKWIASETQIYGNDPNCAMAWNYAAGEIRTPEELLTRMSHMKHSHRSDAVKLINRTESYVTASNSSIDSPFRLQIAKVAHDAFLCLFAANTGMNEAQIIKLKLVNFIELIQNQNTSSIKPRAGYKDQEHPITKRFKKYAEKFLALRKLMLKNLDCEYAFLSWNRKSATYASPLPLNSIGKFYQRIEGLLGIKFVPINTTTARQIKSKFLIKKHNPLVASEFLQNSPQTILRNYTQGNMNEAEIELTAFYEKLNQRITIISSQLDSNEIPAGQCLSYKNPSKISSVDLEPNCKNFLGCLFCSNLALHADDNDIRKLHSMSFFITEMKASAKSEDTFFQSFGRTLSKVSSALNQIASISEDRASRVKDIGHEVSAYGEMTSYWNKKLFMLVRAGAIV